MYLVFSSKKSAAYRAMLLFVLFACSSFVLQAQSVPERVEPPFWWTGMHHTELQIMIHGEDIGKTFAVIDHPGVRLTQSISVVNPDYLFLYLDIASASPGAFDIIFFLEDAIKYSYRYELFDRAPDSRYRQGLNAADAMYLLMPDRFANGNPSLDDQPGMLERADRYNPDGRHGGDIKGIINHLDHIADMGFTAIWINPLLENNQPRYSYHGYATTDYYKIDPRFGTNEDYRELVSIAGEKGIKIIKDLILNHCGHHHWWMNDLPASDWINKWDSFTRTTYRISTQLDPHAAYADYAQMAYGWFDTNMPDLNQRNRLLAQYLKQNAVWWIEYSGIRGIRMDTQPYSDRNFMSDWAGYVRNEYPDFLIIGEAWVGVPALISYFQGGKQNHDGYDSHMPSVFDFAMYDAIRSGLTEQEGWSSGLMRLYDVLAQDFLYPDPYNLVIFADNHDVSRIFSVLGEDQELLKMALTFIFTTRGIPQVYYGTELLMSGWEHEGHGNIREDFPGGWAGDATNAFLPEGRSHQQQQITDHISDLLHFRKSKSALHYGWLRHFVPRDNVYVYFRYDETDTIMVIMNANDEPYDLGLSRFREVWEGFGSAEDVLNGRIYNHFDTWTIPGRTALVLELR